MNSGQPIGTSAQVWRRTTELTHRSLAGITVVRLLSDENQIVLRSFASLIWIGLQSPSSVAELAEDLRFVDDAATDQLVAAELDRLEAYGLVASDG